MLFAARIEKHDVSTLILCFHRVADPHHGGRSQLAISESQFGSVLDEVGRHYDFVDLTESIRPSRTRRAVVTFDDGYADNYYTALPILKARGIASTFFVSTGFIDRQVLFSPDAVDAFFSDSGFLSLDGDLEELRSLSYWQALDRVAELGEDHYWRILTSLSSRYLDSVTAKDPYRRPLTWDELKDFSRDSSVTLGAHTVTHRRLSKLSLAEATREASESMSWFLERGLVASDFFAFPYGQKKDLQKELTRSLREEHTWPLTTLPALSGGGGDVWFRHWGLPRLSVGPAELPLMPLLVKMLPLVTPIAPLWLGALALRRTLLSGVNASRG